MDEDLVDLNTLSKFFSVKPSTIRYWTTTGVIPTEAVVKITPKVVRYDFNKVKAALYKRVNRRPNILIHKTEEKEIEVEKPKKTLVGDIQTQIDYLKQLNEEK
jgi:hypothetical protein